MPSAEISCTKDLACEFNIKQVLTCLLSLQFATANVTFSSSKGYTMREKRKKEMEMPVHSITNEPELTRMHPNAPE